MCCCSPPPPASKAEEVVCRTRARKLHSHSNPHFCNLAIYYLSILYLGLLLLFLCSLPSFLFIFFSRMQRSKSASTTRPSSLTTNKRSNIILRRRSAGSLGNISTAATSPGIGGPAPVSGKVLNKRSTHRETEIRRERRSVCVCASAYVCACMWEIERDRLPKVGKKFRYQNRVGNIYTDPGNILTSPSRPGGHPDVTRSLTS